MSTCCATSSDENTDSRRHRCPLNGIAYPEVALSTLLQHVRRPWEMDLKQQRYYFCDDPDCDVVYFGEDGSYITRDKLRQRVGIKERDENSEICYCFGISRAMAKNEPQTRDFVIQQTKQGLCACAVRNPSGRCCLKDFPKPGDKS